MSKKSNWGRIMLSGVSLAAMGAFASPALAQDADEVTDEIVVTATGRAAAIQDVPLAVTAVSGEQLENSGVQDLRDVTQVAPSLSMGTGQSNSSGTIARIRGIGTGSDNPGFEGAVGIFIDGVYRARAGAALADLPELERVEILRGPQGTLFGRNTSAGAISVISAGPGFEPGMYIQGDVGLDDLEELGLEAGINVPVSDALAFRVDGVVRDRAGYITDAAGGDDLNSSSRWSARAQATYDFSPDASLRIIADGAGSDSVCCGVSTLSFGSTSAIVSLLTGGGGATPGGGVVAANPESRRMTVTPGRNFNETTDEHGISAQLDWDLGGVNFTSITANRHWEADRNQDIDYTSLDVAYRDGLEVSFDNFTQEFRLQGEVGRVNWLVGLFYGHEDLSTTDTIRTGASNGAYTNTAVIGGTAAGGVCTPNTAGAELYNFTAQESIFQCAVTFLPVPLQAAALTAVNSVNSGYLIPNATGQGQNSDVWDVETESLALFTHNEISITDQLLLTIGLRYNQETKDVDANLLATSNACTSLQAMETATLASFGPANAGGGGVVTFLQRNGFATPMNLACNPAVNTISNGVYSGDNSEEELSGTASLAYHVNDDIMVYGGYSRGYKAGGFNVDRQGFTVTPATISAAGINLSQTAFDPEFTDAYEIGVKTTLFGGSTTFNVTGFYEEIHDYQLNAFNGFNFITRNVPEVLTQGVEIEASTSPMEGLNFNGGVVYTNANYESEVRFNPNTACVSGPSAVNCSVVGSTPNANDPNAVYSGSPLSFAPEFVVTGSVSYRFPLTESLGMTFYADGRWNSEYRTQTLGRSNDGLTDNEAYAIYNGRIGIGPQNERWSLELFGQNLTDEFYYVGAFSPPLQDSRVIFPNEPRTYGVSLRLQY